MVTWLYYSDIIAWLCNSIISSCGWMDIVWVDVCVYMYMYTMIMSILLHAHLTLAWLEQLSPSHVPRSGALFSVRV